MLEDSVVMLKGSAAVFTPLAMTLESRMSILIKTLVDRSLSRS
jgi:hypothetical protein